MAIHGYGITLSYDDGGSPVSITDITEITPPEVTKETIETTHHGSSGGAREFISGLVDGGEMSVTVNYDPGDTSHSYLRTAANSANSGTPDSFTLTYSDSSTDEFSGYVTGMSVEAPMDDKVSATFTIKITGTSSYS